MLNKNTYGAKKVKQQLSDYGYISILAAKSFDISLGQELASYNLLFRGCHESTYILYNLMIAA